MRGKGWGGGNVVIFFLASTFEAFVFFFLEGGRGLSRIRSIPLPCF